MIVRDLKDLLDMCDEDAIVFIDDGSEVGPKPVEFICQDDIADGPRSRVEVYIKSAR